MPYELSIDAEHGVTHSRFWGDVVWSEVEAQRAELLAHPDFHDDLTQLIDAAHAVPHFEMQRMDRFAMEDPFSTTARRAIIVPDDLLFGSFRVYGAQLGPETDGLRACRPGSPYLLT